MKSAAFTCSLLVVFLFLLTSIVSVAPANAQEASLRITFTVSTTADTHDANQGDGVCADQNGQCSLRAAIEEADAQPYGSTAPIAVPAGTYRLLKGVLRLSDHRSIMINGAASKTTIIKGNKTFRIMSIGSPSLFVQLSQLTIEGGNTAGGNGGGIENYGTLLVSNSIISHNMTPFNGGGIFNESSGQVSLSNSILSNNSVGHDGGGIENLGKLTVNNSTLSGNSAIVAGGGIDNDGGGTVSVTNTTLSNNSVNGSNGNTYGGGIANFPGGTLTVSDSILSGNSATSLFGYGGGIDNSGTLTVSDSIFNGNKAGDLGGGVITGYEGGGKASVTGSTFRQQHSQR